MTASLSQPAAPPCTLVIFGAAGDLTKRLLIPAIYNLTGDGFLDDGMQFIGADHNARDTDGWRSELREAIEGFAKDPSSEFSSASIDERRWSWLAERLNYVVMDFEKPADYTMLGEKIAAAGGGNAIFYLAVAARFFGTIADGLHAAGLLDERAGVYRRIVIEKPFGSDLPSAQALNRQLLADADESQLYRIDHFLGKNAVQGLAALRFDNVMLEALLRREWVDHVQISAAETLGVEERGSFYESTGALRDMVSNHLLSVLTVLTMEIPGGDAPDDLRGQKTQLLRAMRPVAPADAVRGQYAAGREKGGAVPAYRAEHGVAPESRTETYAALAAYLDNPRWSGVPFYLRTGKRLQRHVTRIDVHLRDVAKRIVPASAGAATPNAIVVEIDPQQTLSFVFGAKAPATRFELGAAAARFAYADRFPKHEAVGYETLLYACMCGDQTNFQRADTIEASWAAIQPVIDAWQASPDAPQPYESGSAGPPAADALLARTGRAWDDLTV